MLMTRIKIAGAVLLSLGLAGGAGASSPEAAKDKPRPENRLLAQLSQPVRLPEGFPQGTTLSEALRDLSERYGVTILIDEDALKQDQQIQEPENHPVKLPPMIGVKLATVLRMLMDQAQAAFLVRLDFIEVTSPQRRNAEVWGPWSDNLPLMTLVNIDFDKRPLDEALLELENQTGGKITLNAPAAGDKAKAAVTAALTNVPLDTAVRFLANQAGLTAVLLDDGLYVTAVENAQPVDYSPKDLESLWARLAADDARTAQQAILALRSAPRRTVPFLQEKLRAVVPVPVADPERLASLIADLDNDEFAVREKASRELERLGTSAESTLRKKFAGDLSSLELRRRIERLLEKLDKKVPKPEQLQPLRAVRVLEHVASPEAREVLKDLAIKKDGAWLALAAKASSERLAKRESISVRGGNGPSPIYARLIQPIKLPEGFPQGTTLDEALKYLGERYQVKIRVDSATLKSDLHMDNPEMQKVTLPPMINVKLDTVLRLLAGQRGFAFLVRPDHIEITSPQKQNAEAWGMTDPAEAVTGRLFLTLPRLVNVEFDKRPLDEALQELSAQASGTSSIVLDAPRAGAKAKTAVTGTLLNVPLETAVHLLASQAQLTCVSLDNVLYVTTIENAGPVLYVPTAAQAKAFYKE